MPVSEIKEVCYRVKANQEERTEAYPPDEGEAFSHDFGMSISTKILNVILGCTWAKVFADVDAL